MNNILIPVLVAVVLILLVLFLRRSSARKVSPVESPEDDVSALQEIEPEAEPEPVTDEVEEAPNKKEVKEPEIVEEIEPEPEAEPESISELKSELVVEEEEPAAEERKGATKEDDSPDEPAVVLSIETYEKRLFSLKEKQLAALAEAIENNEESRRERLQTELVALTESLTFLSQSYEHEISCRKNALQALGQMRAELDTAEYEQACEGIGAGDTLDAEKVLDGVADKGSSSSAQAAYQSGLLAECRIDFTRAMDRLEKAVTLEGDNPNYLRSAALLARKLYEHKRALIWFASLEKVLAETGEDTVELALARRNLAYSVALAGRHKQAGALYKQAMISLSKLVGKEDPEMGICWFQIGKLQEALGQYEKAEEPYRKALAIMDKAGANVVTVDILDKLAGLYMELERELEAIPLFERLCALKEESPNPDKATLAMAFSNLAEAYRVCGKYSEAEEKYMRSLAITEDLRGKDHAAVGSVLQELAQLCQRQGKKDEAQAHQDRAAAIFQRVLEEQEAAGQEKSVEINL